MDNVRRQFEPDIQIDTKSKQLRLTKQQFEILEFIYAYRFVTTKQVQLFLGKKQLQQAQQRLNTLLAKGYIGRKFTNEDRLLGRYATYFLLLDGIRLLKYCGHPQALKNMRKDATASENFMKHCVAIGDVAHDLQRIYSDAKRLLFFTKSELMRSEDDDGSDDYEPSYASFPQPLPDIYLDYIYGGDDWLHYLAEVWHDTVPFWVYRKRIKYYVECVDDGTREEAFDSGLSPVLLICDTPRLQRRVQRYLRRMVDSIEEDELKFLVTNRRTLREADEDTGIWTVVGEDGSKVIKLADLPVNP
jgi:Replication-relaxation